MAGIARIGDRHEGICDHGYSCCPHHVSGTIVSGSNDVANSSNIARDGDRVVHNCPHCGTGHIVASNKSVNVNKKPIATIGDKVVYPGGSGTIVSGSSNVNVGKR